MTIGEISIKRVLSSSIDIYKTSFRSKSKVKAEQLTKRKMEINKPEKKKHKRN